MKQLKTIALIALLCSATFLKAQTQADTVINYTEFQNHSEIVGFENLNLPVFTGAEQNLQDSIEAVGAALTDSVLKATVINAANVIKDVPKGGTVEDWIGYVFGALAALFGIYQYFSKRLHREEAKRTKEALVVTQRIINNQKTKCKESPGIEYKDCSIRPQVDQDKVIVRPPIMIREDRSEPDPNDNSGYPEPQIDTMYPDKKKRPAIPEELKNEEYVKAFNEYTELFGHMPMDNLTTVEMNRYIKRRNNRDLKAKAMRGY